jgi:hypothetical protein
MPKQIQLTIDDPCHENWDAMTPSEKGRFCGSCQKQVVDFTNMSESQLVAFFKKKSTGSVCGRFMPEQLDRSMDIPKKRIPWVKYFFQFTLPLFIGSLKAGAQMGKPVVKQIETAVKCIKEPDMVKGEIAVVPQKTKSFPETYIAGVVKGPDNSPVAYASIVVKGTMHGVSADSTGFFRVRIPASDDGLPVLSVSCVGFHSYEVQLTEIDYLKRGHLTIRLEVKNVEEAVVVAYQTRKGGVRMVMGGIMASAPIIEESAEKKQPVVDLHVPAALHLPAALVYPNPLPSGAAINIKCENMDEDYYALQLTTISGQLVFRREVWIDKEARVLNIPLPRVTAGNYLLIMTGREKQKRFTEKIIIR